MATGQASPGCRRAAQRARLRPISPPPRAPRRAFSWLADRRAAELRVPLRLRSLRERPHRVIEARQVVLDLIEHPLEARHAVVIGRERREARIVGLAVELGDEPRLHAVTRVERLELGDETTEGF